MLRHMLFQARETLGVFMLRRFQARRLQAFLCSGVFRHGHLQAFLCLGIFRHVILQAFLCLGVFMLRLFQAQAFLCICLFMLRAQTTFKLALSIHIQTEFRCKTLKFIMSHKTYQKSHFGIISQNSSESLLNRIQGCHRRF